MTEASTDPSFEKIVEWASRTLPEKIRNLLNVPGIQVADEPPEEMFQKIVEEREMASRY
jgi:predicted Zn-dependent protease with MMP-like domain